MTTISYPVTGENITHGLWSKIEQRHHQGIDVGMALSLSSTEATVAVGRCAFMGFELEVTVAQAFTLASPVTSTTYVIGVLYTPADEAEAYGPLTLVSGIKGAVVEPLGGEFWPLYEVTRLPAQALTAAATKSYAVQRPSVLFKPTGVSDPDPSAAVGAQVLVSATGVKVLVAGAWVAVGDTRRVANGSRSIASLANGDSDTYSITFPAGEFTSTPRVFLSTTGTRLNLGVTNVTTAGFTLSAANYSGGTSLSATAYWTAEQL